MRKNIKLNEPWGKPVLVWYERMTQAEASVMIGAAARVHRCFESSRAAHVRAEALVSDSMGSDVIMKRSLYLNREVYYGGGPGTAPIDKDVYRLDNEKVWGSRTHPVTGDKSRGWVDFRDVTQNHESWNRFKELHDKFAPYIEATRKKES